jgi:hypothetical protein
MLTIPSRCLSLHSARTLAGFGMINIREQKRHSSLTLQTLNPLVKEVEYAVRGTCLHVDSRRLSSFIFVFND